MSTQTTKNSLWSSLAPLSWAGLGAYLMLVALVYVLHPVSPDFVNSGFQMLIMSWQNPAYDYGHGWLVIPICIWLLVHSCRKINKDKLQGSMHGLWLVFLGSFLFILSFHAHQWRITNGALPLLLLGGIWYFWGKHCAVRCAFPLCFMWFCIPVPIFQHATSGMQIMATNAAAWGTSLLGIQTIQEGTSLTLASGEGLPFSIAGGCSGMRSLMALAMISVAWGYLADKLQLWKRVLLMVSAIPLAIVANAIRVTSIFICAEYIDPAFASKTWHDWSGLLFFFPASLLGITLIHGLLAGEIPFMKRRRIVIRNNNAIQ